MLTNSTHISSAEVAWLLHTYWVTVIN